MTMTEVAKLAGVSQATVSRVVNDPEGVNEETRQKVLEAMSKTGYKPLKRQKQTNAHSQPVVALLNFDTDQRENSDIITTTLQGVLKALSKRQLSLVYAHVQHTSDLPACITERKVHGIICMGSVAPDEIMDELSPIPLVWISSYRYLDQDRALMGNEAIGRLAANYLMERGHEKLAFINPFGEHPALKTRGESFQFFASQRKKQVELSAGMCLSTDANVSSPSEELEKAIRDIVAKSLERGVTGLFIPADMLTALAYRAFAELGVGPGKDFDVISCNAQQGYLLGLSPRPATIDIGLESMGERAVEQLHWQIDHPGERLRSHVVVEPELIEGEIAWKRD